jgi:hypothetical protein
MVFTLSEERRAFAAVALGEAAAAPEARARARARRVPTMTATVDTMLQRRWPITKRGTEAPFI